MLFHANLPLKLWVDAFLTVIHLINQLPSSSLGSDTPFHKFFKRHQDYQSLQIFGRCCFPYLRNYGVNKFSKKTYPCVFIGYSPQHKGYRCFHPTTNRVYISCHVVFYEHNYLFTSSINSSLQIPLEMVAQGDHATLDHNPCAHSQISNSCIASLYQVHLPHYKLQQLFHHKFQCHVLLFHHKLHLPFHSILQPILCLPKEIMPLYHLL